MLTRVRKLATMLLVAVVAVSSAASAQTFDLAQDWSSTTNPAGPWSYLAGSTLLPRQETVCCGIPGPAFAPSPNVGDFLPVFWRPGAAGSDVFVHSNDPANAGFEGEAVLAWTAPTSGVLDFSGYFYYAHAPQQRSNDIIIRNGSSLLGTETVSYLNFVDNADRWNFAFDNLAVSAGDIVSVTFQRSVGFDVGGIVAGNVMASLVPSASVPEPSALALLLTALGALVVVGQSKKVHRKNKGA